MIDLTQMDAVDDAVDDFAETMAEQSGDVAPAVGQSEATTLGFGKSPDESQDKHLSDLGLLAAAIGEAAPEVADQADARRRRARRGRPRLGRRRRHRRATGLSIYLPPVAELADPAYVDVASSDDWADFLDAYYGAGEAIPARSRPRSPTRTPGRRSSSRTTAASPSRRPSTPRPRQHHRGDDQLRARQRRRLDHLLRRGGRRLRRRRRRHPGGVRHLRPDRAGDRRRRGLGLRLRRPDLSEDLSTGFFDVPMTYYASTDPDQVDPQGRAALAGARHRRRRVRQRDDLHLRRGVRRLRRAAPDPEGIIVPDVLTDRRRRRAGLGAHDRRRPLRRHRRTSPTTSCRSTPGTVLQVDLTIYDFGGNSSTLSSYVEVP